MADVTILASDFGFVLQGDHELQLINAANYTFNYERFYNTEAQALAAAVSTPDHFEPVGRFVHNLAGDNYYVGAGMSIQAAINASSNGETVNVRAGTFNEDVLLNKSITLQGAGAANTTVSGPIGGQGSTISIIANNAIVDGFTVTRDGNNVTDWNNVSLNSGGITIQGLTITGVEIRNNTITGMRSGIDLNNTSGVTNIHHNLIDNNHTGMIMRNAVQNTSFHHNTVTNNRTLGLLFLVGGLGEDVTGSTFNNNVIAGNWYRQIENRSLTVSIKNFENNWYGTAVPAVTNVNSSEPGYASLIPVAYGGSAVPPVVSYPEIGGVGVGQFDYSPWCTNVGCTTFASVERRRRHCCAARRDGR